MQWRVRTTLPDRPGLLARIAAACGEAELNIVGMQVFPGSPHVTDELVVVAPDGWTDVQVADLFEKAGGEDVVATRVSAGAPDDAPTRYLAGASEVLDGGRPVEEVLRELLGTETPDVADYRGHDVLDLVRRDGRTLRVSRAVPFTPVERSRAQALLSLVGDAGFDQPLIAPTDLGPSPMVRDAAPADLEGVAALHERCSIETLYARYQVPLRMPLTTRMARRLVQPDHGHALVVQSGLDLVAHAVLEEEQGRWTLRILVEDAWRDRGLTTMLVRQGARVARERGLERLTIVSGAADDRVLRAVGSAGFVARVERHDDELHVTLPLSPR
ncbi:GNAT family N-acetyltransferase [Aeromicrobium terrae]|uniref:ACT domain-containing protein n=1 Tax=Aeromicrobium terrae TaxID=2498846 RepID=A0A5C8NPE5_9ACTN|nr:GNAT family N-acetyltransferase [Aeromicrobium terrae]TXL63006.1 ACT domain-containing protein [Aeromicrobium terrae]